MIIKLKRGTHPKKPQTKKKVSLLIAIQPQHDEKLCVKNATFELFWEKYSQIVTETQIKIRTSFPSWLFTDVIIFSFLPSSAWKFLHTYSHTTKGNFFFSFYPYHILMFFQRRWRRRWWWKQKITTEFFVRCIVNVIIRD